MLAILILASSLILLFFFNLKKTVCGNGLCEISENSLNCCEDCGCYRDNEVCVNNKCIAKEITLSDEEFMKIVTEYFRLKNENIQEIGEIYNLSLKKMLAKSTIIRTDKRIYGVTIAENKTLFLYECCGPTSNLLDVWSRD